MKLARLYRSSFTATRKLCPGGLGLAVWALAQCWSPPLSSAATVWTGPQTNFSKAAFADPTQAANQDRLTANVWITRGTTQGLYNAKTESFFTHSSSPADTEWANGTTANYQSLSYTDWNTWAKTINGGPPSTVGKPAVVHLKSDDIYLDIVFTSWGGSGGAFAYSRSTPSIGNVPPSVTITNPTDGATFSGPATVMIQTAASDADGTVTNVEFFDGNVSLGNVAVAPYDLAVSLAVGSHRLTAVASDNFGATASSSAVTVTVISNSPPSVAIINPTNGSVFAAPATVSLQVSASDSDGSVSQVQFFNGTTLLGELTNGPYVLVITNLAAGNYDLVAVATDNLNLTATNSISITVTNVPLSSVLIGNVTLTNGIFSFSFGTQAGFDYDVQVAPMLDPKAWASFTNITGDGSPAQVIVPRLTSSSGYYRVLAH